MIVVNLYDGKECDMGTPSAKEVHGILNGKCENVSLSIFSVLIMLIININVFG